MTTRLVIKKTVDTRAYEHGRVVPGSGEHEPCSHCGKDLAIHVYVADCETVRNSAGTVVGFRPVTPTRIIGRDCAKKLGADDRRLGVFRIKWMEAAS